MTSILTSRNENNYYRPRICLQSSCRLLYICMITSRKYTARSTVGTYIYILNWFWFCFMLTYRIASGYVIEIKKYWIVCKTDLEQKVNTLKRDRKISDISRSYGWVCFLLFLFLLLQWFFFCYYFFFLIFHIFYIYNLHRGMMYRTCAAYYRYTVYWIKLRVFVIILFIFCYGV